MKNKLFYILMLTSLTIVAQTDKKIDLRQGSIKEKFEAVYNKSSNYQNYKIIKQDLITQLKRQVLDTISKHKDAYSKTIAEIEKLNKQITDLQSQLDLAKNEITSLKNEKDSISFLGNPINKTRYQLIMWLLVLGLLLALLYFIYLFKNSVQITKTAKDNLYKLEDEYNSFRELTLEREQLLKRQLLDAQKQN